MWITLAANAINISADYVFIFGAGPLPALGVEGAGMATAASNLFMLSCFVWVVHRPGTRFAKFGARLVFKHPRRDLLVRTIAVGLPMGVQLFLEIGAFLVFSVMVGWVGDKSLAAHQVILRLWSVGFMTAWGISTAATTLVGRKQGEGNSAEALADGLRTVRLASVVALSLGAIYMLLPGPLVSLFTEIADVATIATSLVWIAALNQFLDAINIVAYGALKGAGDTRWPMWIVVVTNWTLGVPMVYLLTFAMGLGVTGTWFGMAIVLGAQATLMLARFRYGRWREIQLVRE
jgi:MATE family multidrug resistance protein